MAALSLLFIAAGAVMRFAVADNMEGVDLEMFGLILMVVGAVGLVVALITRSGRTRATSTRTVSPDGRTVIEDQHSTSL